VGVVDEPSTKREDTWILTRRLVHDGLIGNVGVKGQQAVAVENEQPIVALILAQAVDLDAIAAAVAGHVRPPGLGVEGASLAVPDVVATRQHLNRRRAGSHTFG
jgi:hypothetical protein